MTYVVSLLLEIILWANPATRPSWSRVSRAASDAGRYLRELDISAAAPPTKIEARHKAPARLRCVRVDVFGEMCVSEMAMHTSCARASTMSTHQEAEWGGRKEANCDRRRRRWFSFKTDAWKSRKMRVKLKL